MVQAGRSRVQFPMMSLDFRVFPYLSSRAMALGWTQRLRSIFLGGKGHPARKADNLTAVCELNIYKCEILDVSQSCGPPRSVTGTALQLLLLPCGC
jgi:hypothetical protein